MDEYRGLMEDSFNAISGLVFNVTRLVVDKDTQQIAARIEFSGVPVRKYAGVEPNGNEVRFCRACVLLVGRRADSPRCDCHRLGDVQVTATGLGTMRHTRELTLPGDLIARTK